MGDTTVAEPINDEDTTAFAAETTAIILVTEGLAQLGPHPDLPIDRPLVIPIPINLGDDVVLTPIILAVDSKSVIAGTTAHTTT